MSQHLHECRKADTEADHFHLAVSPRGARNWRRQAK
jgi:hypothetical protein